MAGKMVDFAVVLKPDDQVMGRIRRLLGPFKAEERYLNQTTDYDAVRECPIFLNVETKTPNNGGQDADIQLSTWAGAGFAKLEQLLDGPEASKAKVKGKKQGKNQAKDDKTIHPPIPTMPLLSIHGPCVRVSALQRTSAGNVHLEDIELGNVKTILGIFKILRGLDILVSWGHNEYRAWYLENILTPEPANR